ncbi:MAG: hypothetical protein WC867_00290 [Candidatus Pacearchaeota archaeon]
MELGLVGLILGKIYGIIKNKNNSWVNIKIYWFILIFLIILVLIFIISFRVIDEKQRLSSEDEAEIINNAVDLKDYSICEEIRSSLDIASKFNCISKVSIAKEDLETCINLNDYYCISYFARTRNDSSLCKNLDLDMNYACRHQR